MNPHVIENLPPSYYCDNQRRLFDSLRNEKSALIVVYSSKDQKVIFGIKSQKHCWDGVLKNLWLISLPFCMKGMNEWRKALSSLASVPESQARLLAKTKQGQEALLNCQLGIIQTGLFRNYIIGVFYPT